MQSLLYSALIASLLTCGTALAQAAAPSSDTAASAPQQVKRHPSRFDKDGDGFISRQEAAGNKMLEKNFDAIDSNKDGKLSKEEIRAFHQSKRAQHKEKKEEFAARFKAADKDGDGALTRQEAEAGKMPMVAKHFDQIDTNHDGKITPEEMQAARKNMRGKRGPGQKAEGDSAR